jgi:GTP-binding protein HflX
LLLHVVDSASPDREQQIEAVNQVLGEIGAGDVPQILIWNKIDETHAQCGVEYDAYGKLRRVLLSAKTGEGIGALRAALGEIAKSFNARVQSAASSSACEPIAPSLEPGAHTHFQQD